MAIDNRQAFGNTVNPASVHPGWRVAQTLMVGVGISIIYLLWFYPSIGKHALWNLLITAAPALLVLAPGLWRNICPVGTISQYPARLGFNPGNYLSQILQDKMYIASIVLLFILVPLRHVVTDGPILAIVLVVVSMLAFFMGWNFRRKSGWCSTLCPVYPVERLYGIKPLVTTDNAHCSTCEDCVSECDDTNVSSTNKSETESSVRKLTNVIFVGGFPGFVWGWFQVSDYAGVSGWSNLETVYGYPIIGAIATLVLYSLAKSVLSSKYEAPLLSLFATAAISCYYWYRIPAIVGVGVFPGQGMLIDLSNLLPAWFPILSGILIVGLFSYLLIIRPFGQRTWTRI